MENAVTKKLFVNGEKSRRIKKNQSTGIGGSGKCDEMETNRKNDC